MHNYRELNSAGYDTRPNFAAIALSRRHRLSIPAAMVTAELLGLSGPAPDPWITATQVRLAREVRS